MTTSKMHENEVHTDEALVRRLLRAQFPEWADLPIAPPLKTGTSNAIFRLGDDLSVRLPRIDWAVKQVSKEQTWLPRLAPQLPLGVPVPIAVGVPGDGYPFPWSVCQWFEGRAVTYDGLADPVRAAQSLAAFTVALQSADATGGPTPTPPGSIRGAPLATLDEQVRQCVDQLGDLIDRDVVLAAWDASLDAPVHDGRPVWIHGDLSPGNLIERDGELVAVIDYGCMAVGDPASDLLIGWNLFRGASRTAYREAAGVDDATWLRGRGWALYGAMIALPYYLHTNPPIVELSWHMLREVLRDAE